MSERTFRVIAMAAFGRRVTYKKNDIVKESAFPPGNADKLVRQKFLIEIDPTTKFDIVTEELAPEKKSEEDRTIMHDLRGEKQTIKPVNKSLQTSSQEDEEEDKNTVAAEQEEDSDRKINVSVEKIIQDLKKAKIPFNRNSTKEELYELWLSID